MKKPLYVFLSAFFVLILAGCGGAAKAPADPAPAESGQRTSLFTLVEGAGTDTLLLAGETAGEVFTLDAKDLCLFQDGSRAEPSALQNGQQLEVSFESLGEGFPAAVLGAKTASIQPCRGYFDLCGLYLQVLEDLWGDEPALDDAVKFINVDLSTAPGSLTEGEKAAIAHVFARRHGARALTLTYEQLGAQGYLGKATTATNGTLFYTDGFQDGLSFSISPAVDHFSGPTRLWFSAQKYAGPLAAVFFEECSAFWPEGKSWADGKADGYTVESYAVS